jgi:beta-lactam-binding protein with PASTA domain
VPNVIGQTLANAAQTLASAGYPNIAVAGSRDPDAIVVDQQPSGGGSADAATRITLTARSSGTTPTNGFGLLN